MLLIPCPWCGPRAETEFTGGKQTGRVRPSAGPKPESDAETAVKDAIEDDKAWAAYLFQDANAPEQREERWCHTHGCGQWFVLVRDTGTGFLGKASRLAPPPPPPTAPLPPAPKMEPAEPPAEGDGS
jgi:sarcosine oxidase, subunit alpha